LLNIIFACVVYLFVPETRGVSLEHIERNMMAGQRLRELGAKV
jgi:hypothetical protein